MKNYKRLPLHHGHNVRDLGGYPLENDGMIAWHKLYRADNLHALDEHDWMYVKDANITCILDLRSLQEQADAPYACEQYGIEHYALPFMKQEIEFTDSISEDAKMKFLSSMKLDYVAMLQEATDKVVLAFQKIASVLAKGEAVLFHCTAGKDRTGILATLLLDVCGVDARDILADYQTSSTYNVIGVNQLLPSELMQIPEVKALFASNVEMMQPLLDFLHTQSTQQYLSDIGVDANDIRIIKQQMIVQ